MQRRYNLAHFILAGAVVLGLTPLMVCAAPQAQIAFASDRDGNWEIYVMDTDGRNQRRLTTNRHDDWEPSWSPDGKRIAFTSSEARNVWDGHPQNVVGGSPQIYVMDADGKNLRRLSNNHFAEWEPSWSPDGKRIAFTSRVGWGNWYIYVMDADGENLRRLGQHEQDGWYPSWSPDGKRIAFISWRDERGKYDIYAMDADGGNQQRLTENPADDLYPSWSPDGERVVFVSDRDGNFEIYVMDADGKNQRRLTRNASPDTDPSWSPDGKRIVFVSTRTGNKEIYVMNADGARQVRRRTKDGRDDTDPAWFDSAFAVEVAPFAVSPTGKKFTMWGWLKQVAR